MPLVEGYGKLKEIAKNKGKVSDKKIKKVLEVAKKNRKKGSKKCEHCDK